jgi:hypothetical protein
MRTPLLALLAVLALLVACAIFKPAPLPDYPGAIWIPAGAVNFTPADRGRDDIRWIVIHDTEETSPETVAIFTSPERQTSAHFVVTRDGHVIQMVHLGDIAHQAGNWAYNRMSVGIEHEYYRGHPYTPEEYEASAKLVRWLLTQVNVEPYFPMTIGPASPEDGSGIIGHRHVPDTRDPRRGGGVHHHMDPQHWDWAAYIAMVGGHADAENLARDVEHFPR